MAIKNKFQGGYGGGSTSSPTPSGGNIGGALAGLISVGADFASQAMSNKQRRKLENAARKYNLEQWHRQNKYNHPLQQMARLTEAGLNPNMIYGSSPGSAVGNASSVAPGKAPEYNLNNPVGPGITLGQNTRVQQAQTNNLKTQSNLNTSNAIKSIAQSGLAKAQENQITKMLSGNYEIQQEQVKQAKIGTFLKTLEKTGKSANYLAQQAAQTNKMLAEGEIAQAGIALANLNQALAKQGIRPTDPLYIKLLGQVFGMDLSKPNVQNDKNIRTFLQYLNK